MTALAFNWEEFRAAHPPLRRIEGEPQCTFATMPCACEDPWAEHGAEFCWACARRAGRALRGLERQAYGEVEMWLFKLGLHAGG